MERSFEVVLAEQCAPTLAGVKVASLFCWGRSARAEVERWALEFAAFGIGLRILKTCPSSGRSLIFLYRGKWLRKVLDEQSNQDFLEGLGYDLTRGYGGLLRQLSQRLCLGREFPHEIGLFLGYPLEDVIGFIKNCGQNYTCCGCWKSYGDPDTAQICFDKYHRCTEAYRKRVRMGVPITQLIITYCGRENLRL